MKRKELIKIINNLVLLSYTFSISPVMAMEDESSSVFLSENDIDDENVPPLEDDYTSNKEDVILDSTNNNMNNDVIDNMNNDVIDNKNNNEDENADNNFVGDEDDNIADNEDLDYGDEDNLNQDSEDDLNNEDIYLEESDDEIVSDIESDINLKEEFINKDVIENIENNSEMENTVSVAVEDNWLNREVASQIYGDENKYVDLTDADYLNVTYIIKSGVTGGIPDSIGKLKNLTCLIITQSDLSEGISDKLGTLTSLLSLELIECQLNSEIPQCIFNLSNLDTLRLTSNNLTGSIPEEICNLTKLRELELYDNKLEGNIPDSIGSLTELECLYLAINELSGEIPESIGMLTNLRDVMLDYNNFTGKIPESICNLTNLTSLSLSSNRLNGEIPKNIGNLKNLSSLGLSYNRLTGNVPSSIKNMTELQVLALDNNKLSGEIDADILNLPNLIYEYYGTMGVRFYNNNFTGNIPDNIKSSVSGDVFKNNLFKNMENQKYFELTDDDDVVVELGEKANINGIESNVTVFNHDGTVYGDSNSVNYSFEYEYDKDILDDNFVGIKIGSLDIAAKMSETEMVSRNNILVEVKDTLKPNIDATVSSKEWTTGSVDISISISDNDSIEKIILPDGNEVEDTNLVYTVSNNGQYVFTAIDKSGNYNSKTITINNIDKEAPIIKLSLDKSDWTNGSVGIKIATSDDCKVSKVILPDGRESGLKDLTYNTTSNGDYEFTAIDGVGNIVKEKISVKNIDNNKPTIALSASSVKADNSVDIKVTVNDNESGIQDIEMTDGTKLDIKNNIVNVKKNGVYKFLVTDKSGNVNESIIEITNIIDKSLVDEEAPSMSYTLSESNKTNKDVLINVMAVDNKKVDYIVSPDGNKTIGNASIYKADKNGKYKFEAIDSSGNKSEIIVDISNIDKEKVSASVNQSDLLPDKTVNLTLNLNKNDDDINSIKINGTVSIDSSSSAVNVDKNGTYQFFVEDKSKNTTIASTKVDVIPFEGEDSEKPHVNYLLDTYSWVNKKVGIYVYASDNQGIKSIKTPDGDIVEDSSVTYMVEENGLYEFEVEDLSGNVEVLAVDIYNIDKTNPFVGVVEELAENEDKITVVNVNLKDEDSGIDNIILPNNILVKGDNFKMSIEKDVEYEIIAKDKAGNENKLTIKVDSDKDESDDITGDMDSSDDTNNNENNNSDNNNNSSSNNNLGINNKDSIDFKEDKKDDLMKNEISNEFEGDLTNYDNGDSVESLDDVEVKKEHKPLILVMIGIAVIGCFTIMLMVGIGKKEKNDCNDNVDS